jgi:hypothetical protein
VEGAASQEYIYVVAPVSCPDAVVDDMRKGGWPSPGMRRCRCGETRLVHCPLE